jgi:hypothetical protein
MITNKMKTTMNRLRDIPACKTSLTPTLVMSPRSPILFYCTVNWSKQEEQEVKDIGYLVKKGKQPGELP